MRSLSQEISDLHPKWQREFARQMKLIFSDHQEWVQAGQPDPDMWMEIRLYIGLCRSDVPGANAAAVEYGRELERRGIDTERLRRSLILDRRDFRADRRTGE